jgi:hypothetical protein
MIPRPERICRATSTLPLSRRLKTLLPSSPAQALSLQGTLSLRAPEALHLARPKAFPTLNSGEAPLPFMLSNPKYPPHVARLKASSPPAPAAMDGRFQARPDFGAESSALEEPSRRRGLLLP